jgi:predicted RNA binding protein YcfA (HicA-like mRNA interferase family)
MHSACGAINSRGELLGKLGNISGKEAVKAFEKVGWQSRGQVGSHRILTKPGVRSNLTVPMHAELKQGLLRTLIKVADLTVDEFLALL